MDSRRRSCLWLMTSIEASGMFFFYATGVEKIAELALIPHSKFKPNQAVG